MVYKHLNELSPLEFRLHGDQVDAFLQKEKLWQEWKENNCPNYEKPPARDILEGVKLWEEFQRRGGVKAVGEKPVERKKGKNANKEKEINLGNEFLSKFTEKTAGTISENVGNLKKMGLFDLNTELFKFLDLSKIEVLSYFFFFFFFYLIFFFLL